MNDIYLGDALTYLKSLTEKSIDLIITDSPHQIQTRGAGFRKVRDYMDVIYDNNMADGYSTEVLQQFVRVMKKVNMYIFASKNQLHKLLDFFKDYNVDVLIWHKLDPIPTINNKYLSDIEYIVFIRDKGVKMYNTYHSSSKLFQTMVNKQDAQEYDHPTVKPLHIIETLLLNSSKPGDVVLDPFCGTGTTPLAAKRNDRRYLASEINPKYHNTALMRLEGFNHQDYILKKQGSLTIFDLINEVTS